MLQVSLGQMHLCGEELSAFREKLGSLEGCLGDLISKLNTMESFADVSQWLEREEENLDMQRRKAAELEEALTMICRFYEKSETEIVDCLENGKPQTMDTPLTFTSTGSDEKWASLITF